jgi:peptide/nickel transport system substrate-binding protein
LGYELPFMMIAHCPWARVAVAALLAVSICGCEKHSAPTRAGQGAHPLPPTPRVAPCEPGLAGGRLVIAASATPRTFNPLTAQDAASDSIIRLLNGALVNIDFARSEATPGLAESWSVAPDQKTWTFKLRRGLRWNDGEPLTASDVVFTWNQLMYNRDFNRTTYDLFLLHGKPFVVSQVDELTIQVVTPEIYAPFLEYFGGIPILPRHTLESAAKEQRFLTAYDTTTRPENLVGCGPFRLRQFQSGKQTILERNPEYWAVDKQGGRLPYLDEVVFVIGGGPGTEGVLFLNGKSDVFENVRPEGWPQFKQAADSGGKFNLMDLGVGAERDFLWFNLNSGSNNAGKPYVSAKKLAWFQQKKFRQAVSCAIDRERIAREVFGGRARPTYGFISTENQKWCNTNIAIYSFNLDRARSLLEEIGIKDRNKDGVAEDADGTPIEIVLYSNVENPAREMTARIISECLAAAGIRLVYFPMDFKSLVGRVNISFEYECALMGLGGGGVDPASQLNVLRSSEELHQWYPSQKTPATPWEARIDTLLDAQMVTLDLAERKKAFDEVQAILAEELPMIYTVCPVSYAAARKDLANLRPSVMTPYPLTWNIEELYFKK